MSKVYIKNSTLTPAFLVLSAAVAALAVFISVLAGAQKREEPSMNSQEFRNLIAHPKTKSDHERIADYYDQQAAAYEAEAKRHQELATLYQHRPDRELSKSEGSKGTFGRCESLSSVLHMSAEETHGLAAEQRKLAKEVKK